MFRRTRRILPRVRVRKVLHPHDLIFGEQLPLFMASELASELYVDEVLTGDGSLVILDKHGSMGAMAEAETRAMIANQIMDQFSKGDPHGS